MIIMLKRPFLLLLSMLLLITALCACNTAKHIPSVSLEAVPEMSPETETPDPNISTSEQLVIKPSEPALTPSLEPSPSPSPSPAPSVKPASPRKPAPSTKPSPTSTAYAPVPKNPAVLSAEQEIRIKQDWLVYTFGSLEEYTGRYNPSYYPTLEDYLADYSVDKVSIDNYYGTYNGCVPVMIDHESLRYLAELWNMTVAGITFYFAGGQGIDVWYNGDFYSLESAYAQGLLTKDDLRNIAYYQNGG